MKFSDTRKKICILTLIAVLAISMIITFTSCNRKVAWDDVLEPEDVESIDVTSPAITLPDKPDEVPATDKTRPTSFGEVSVSDACYTLEDGIQNESLFSVSYNSDEALPAYAYAYVPVTNYDGNPYLKIKADCDSVERLAVLAVYYEQYADSRPAVVVYNNAVMDGGNLIICKLNDSVLLDSHYNAIVNEKLTKKTVCGFMLLIDSNPKQVIDEYSGKFTVTELAAVGDDDPDLSQLYAAPYVSGWKAGEGFTSCDIKTTPSESADGLDVEAAYSVPKGIAPRIEANITNYKSDYTTVKMDVKGLNVKTLTIAIKYSFKTTDSIDYNYLSSFNMTIDSEWESMEFDFSVLEELKDWSGATVPGSYVKNLNPTAIYFFTDSNGETANAGTLYVRNVVFCKPSEQGDVAPRVTSTWSLGASGITKSDVKEGGIGTLDYNKRQGWFPVTINVAGYNPDYSVLVVRVKFYSQYSNLGVALGYGSSNTVILQSKGMGAPAGFSVKLISHKQENGTDEKGNYTFHTFEIDFSDASTTNGGNESLANQAITKIMLYVDAAAQSSSGDWIEPSAGNPLNPARKMQFVGIEFRKPQK